MNPRQCSRRSLLTGLTLGAAAVATSGLVGCASSPPQAITSGPVTLDMWTHDEGYVSFFTKVAEEMANRSIFAPKLQVTKSGASDLVTKLIAQAIAGQGTPDLVGINLPHFPRLMNGNIANELLVPLDDLARPFGDDLIRARRSPFENGGQLFALDSDSPLAVYYYRADLFEAYGLQEPGSYASWEEFAEAATPISVAEGVSFGALSVGNDLPQLIQGFELLLLQRGGGLFNAERSASIMTDLAVEVLEFMCTSLRTGFFTTVTDLYGGSVQTALAGDRILGVYMPSWYATYGIKPNVPQQEGRWRVTTAPRFRNGGGRTAVGGGTGFAVVKDKPGTAAAIELLREAYLTPEQQIARYKALGYLPTLRSVFDSPELDGVKDPFFGGQDLIHVFREIIDEIPVVYQNANLSTLNTVLSGNLLQAYRGEIPPAEALKAASLAFDAQIEHL